MSVIVTLDAKVAVLRGHEHYWSVIQELDRRGEPWTVRDIDGRSNGDRSSINDFVRRLVWADYVAVVDERPGPGAATKKFYRLLKNSRETPRLTRDGRELVEALQETLWRSMKLLKTFTAEQLAVAAETPARAIDRIAVDSYCSRLVAGGVLKIAVPGNKAGGRQSYRLALPELGPLAPKILRTRHVYDPNAKRILGVAQAQEER